MTAKSYLNFDLQLDESDGSYSARVVDSPDGQATHHFSLPFSAMELELLILKMGRRRSGVRSLDIGSMDIPSVKKLGGALYDTLFADELAKCFRASLALAEHEGKGLRIRMNLSGAPTLINIPWELLFDKSTNNYIGLSVNTPIIRKLDLTKKSIRQANGALRVLVMISSPTDYDSLDVAGEWERINSATQRLQAEGRLMLERVEPSLVELQRALRRSEYHVFHYIGHGGFDSQNNDGVLVLEDKDKKGHLVSGQYLGALLHDEPTLQLVLLNSCSGARTSVADPFAGIGQSLLQKGIPAVIAMQFEITDQAAITFSQEFYAALADGYAIDAAVAEARKMIFIQPNELEWATPVLYTSIDSGSLVGEPLVPAVKPVDKPSNNAPPQETKPKPQGIRAGWKLGAALIIAILAVVVTMVIFPNPKPILPDTPQWGVIYSSEVSMDVSGGAPWELKQARQKLNTTTDVAIYYNAKTKSQYRYHIVATASDEATVKQLLQKVQSIQKAKGLAVVDSYRNMSDWCSNPAKKIDSASKVEYFECSSGGQSSP